MEDGRGGHGGGDGAAQVILGEGGCWGGGVGGRSWCGRAVYAMWERLLVLSVVFMPLLSSTTFIPYPHIIHPGSSPITRSNWLATCNTLSTSHTFRFVAYYQEELAVYLCSRLDCRPWDFCFDRDLHPRLKHNWCMKFPPSPALITEVRGMRGACDDSTMIVLCTEQQLWVACTCDLQLVCHGHIGRIKLHKNPLPLDWLGA